MTKIVNKNDIIAAGNRVKSARMLSGHSRQSFAKVSDISMATLRAWEEPQGGRSGLTVKGAKRIVQALKNVGIHCCDIWLLHGIGIGPKIIDKCNISEIYEKPSWDEEEAIFKDIESFKINNPDPIIAMVSNQLMVPRFFYGDYVGGSKVSGEKLKLIFDRACIICIEEKILIKNLVYHDNRGYILSDLNAIRAESHLILPEITAAAEIVWHRSRRKIAIIN